jgi:hypothetical protein
MRAAAASGRPTLRRGVDGAVVDACGGSKWPPYSKKETAEAVSLQH